MSTLRVTRWLCLLDENLWGACRGGYGARQGALDSIPGQCCLDDDDDDDNHFPAYIKVLKIRVKETVG